MSEWLDLGVGDLTRNDSGKIEFLVDDRLMLEIGADGVLRLGEGVAVDDAARAFVDAVNNMTTAYGYVHLPGARA